MRDVQAINKLFEGFKIKANCISAERHRHFVYYDVELDPGTRISRISRYRDELAIAMRAKTSLIVKPIPGKGIVRLQTTHRVADKLQFNELFRRTTAPSDATLPFLFGETDEGQPLWVDMAKNPHLLVAGATGSGKSVFLQLLIANAAKRNDTKLFLIDTKRVEFNIYKDPAFSDLVHSVDNDFDSAMKTLQFLNNVMTERYKYMASLGIQSMEEDPIFDKFVLIIDEAADLMLYDRTKSFEKQIAKLAQLARAAGIYMVFATQRPDVSVVTGLIKANFPARLACKVTSKVDSKVVLDRMGAEALAGRGDALFTSPVDDLKRLQVAYVEPEETLKTYQLKGTWQN
jgi:S-DNA-T family DNA segregation ATPase FtsK/SpoIIIE